MRIQIIGTSVLALIAFLAMAPAVAQEATLQPAATQVETKQQPAPKDQRRNNSETGNQRADALRAIMEKLELGQGATVADIGAGKGQDSWVFADVVGQEGRVFAEEIGDGMVDDLKTEADRRNLPQVEPVLGKPDDPCLPAASADLAYMHSVYHHFSQPRPMLRGLWQSLKPGGYLVIVDRHRGTLQDWVAREIRGKQHFWIAETTVVREARETGFAFVGCAEDCWPVDDQFVLIFQRPHEATEPGQDPDRPLPLDLDKARQALLPTGQSFQRPVFVALGESRKLIGPILAQSTGPGLDVVLEEWATQKEERPPLPADITLPAVLTENGDIQLGDEPVDAVFFLDAYHLLFHQETLLAQLHAQLAPGGRLYILDRQAQTELSHREASHHRRIPVGMVKQEMVAAGFRLLSERPAPASDRFLLVFSKSDAAEENSTSQR